MIEKMKSVAVVSTLGSKSLMLDGLRDFGMLHIKERRSADACLTSRLASLQSVRQMLSEYKSPQKTDILSEDDFRILHSAVTNASERKKVLFDQRNRASLESERLSVWGDFNAGDFAFLRDKGIEIHILRMGKKEFEALCADETSSFIKLAPVDKMITVAVIGSVPECVGSASEFTSYQASPSDIRAEVQKVDDEIAKCEKIIRDASDRVLSYDRYISVLTDEIIYSSASASADDVEGLTVLSGYIPSDQEQAFRTLAADKSWAYIIDDISPNDECVPTKVRYGKISALMKPVFDILGTVPGYREYDISFWFLCFFSLFFAMIIGDAGYGLCFLGAGVLLHVRKKRADNLVLLVYVLSVSTVIWGALTGTWFGLERAMNIPILRFFVIPAISNFPEMFGISGLETQNNIMHFCFFIGTVQMSLACVQSIRTKWIAGSLAWLADCGWFLSINGLYYIVLLLVIGKDLSFANIVPFVILGFVLVVLFGGMEPGKKITDGLKAGLGGAFTTFLNTISAFGNVMSYIRLFAVGLASLAIAQSFNSMAFGMSGWLRIFGIVIFILGHVLNLVMGLLSVIVHGVRLNLLEYSNQLGMEWSGVAYEPFRKNICSSCSK